MEDFIVQCKIRHHLTIKAVVRSQDFRVISFSFGNIASKIFSNVQVSCVEQHHANIKSSDWMSIQNSTQNSLTLNPPKISHTYRYEGVICYPFSIVWIILSCPLLRKIPELVCTLHIAPSRLQINIPQIGISVMYKPAILASSSWWINYCRLLHVRCCQCNQIV